MHCFRVNSRVQLPFIGLIALSKDQDPGKNQVARRNPHPESGESDNVHRNYLKYNIRQKNMRGMNIAAFLGGIFHRG
jgi:hypothetical protein